YALRVLLFTGAAQQTVTIAQISEAFGISKEHLRKVVHSLAQLGYLSTSQGRYGGLTLARPAPAINLRDVVQHFESTRLVACFDASSNSCPIDGYCRLKRVLWQAQLRFMETLGEYSLADLIGNPRLALFFQQQIAVTQIPASEP